MEPEAVGHEISIKELGDRLLDEFKNKRRIGKQSSEYKAARKLLNDFAVEMIKADSFSELSPSAEFMLNFLEKIRKTNSALEGRLSGECLSLVNQMIGLLGAAK